MTKMLPDVTLEYIQGLVNGPNDADWRQVIHDLLDHKDALGERIAELTTSLAQEVLNNILHNDCVVALEKRIAELETVRVQLQTALKAAPPSHNSACPSLYLLRSTKGTLEPAPCTCWQALRVEALAEEKP